MEFPFAFEQIQVTNWAYLSSLLMLALFFKFNRFWSVRNFDLFLIVLLAPGVLLVTHGMDRQLSEVEARNQLSDELSAIDSVAPNLISRRDDVNVGDGLTSTDSLNGQLTPGQRMMLWGYIWLFVVGAIFLTRLLLDPILVRKPLLDPNLSVGGLVFLVCSLLAFSFANVIKAEAIDVSGARGAVKLVQREAAEEEDMAQLNHYGPGYAFFHLFPVMPTFSSGEDILETDTDRPEVQVQFELAAKILALIGQVAIVVALVCIGNFHFQNFLVGVGMAAIYLMLPYTAVFAGHVLHVLPAALLIWGVVCYRRPLLAGLFIGSAIGVAYYPIFLLPLWFSFYWEKGFKPFLTGVLVSVFCCVAGLIFTSEDVAQFLNQLIRMFGFWWPRLSGLHGIWELGWDPWFRLPVLVAFIALCVSFAFWPLRKTVGTLIAYTAAVMVAVQFWNGDHGGMYVAWYMPLALATIFRPNLSERDAVTDLEEGFWGVKRLRLSKDA